MEEILDTTLGLTLEEIRSRDIDNLKLIYKNSKRFVFDSDVQAKIFISKCVSQAVKKFGVNREVIAEQYGQNYQGYFNALQKKLKDKNIILEPPRVRKGNDAWRSGVYIYYRNEIAYFISLPVKIDWKKSHDAHIIVPGRHKYMIITNVK